MASRASSSIQDKIRRAACSLHPFPWSSGSDGAFVASSESSCLLSVAKRAVGKPSRPPRTRWERTHGIEAIYRERSYARGRIPCTFTRNESPWPSSKESRVSRAIACSLRAAASNETDGNVQTRTKASDLHIEATLLSKGDEHEDPSAMALSASCAAAALAMDRGFSLRRFVGGHTTDSLSEGGVDRLELRWASDGHVLYWLEARTHGNVRFQEEDVIAHLQQGLTGAEACLQQQELAIRRAIRTKPSWKVDPLTSDDPSTPPFQASRDRAHQIAWKDLRDLVSDTKKAYVAKLDSWKELELCTRRRLRAEGLDRPPHLSHVIHGQILDDMINRATIEHFRSTGKRADGRKPDETRALRASMGLLFNAHGSCRVSTGCTSSLVTSTVGPLDDIPRSLEADLEGTDPRLVVQCFFHPPRRDATSGPSKSWEKEEEDAHARLVEDAIRPLLPCAASFPAAARIAIEVLNDDGSSISSSVCGASMALAEAGVPINEHCAAVSVAIHADNSGDGGRVLLLDPTSWEQSVGAARLEVAGTSGGITALRLEMERPGIRLEELQMALERAKVARLDRLERMERLYPLRTPRVLSDRVPRAEIVPVRPEAVGKIIGPGGSTIRALESDTGAKLSVREGKEVLVFGPDRQSFERAKESILQTGGGKAEEGRAYEARVVRIQDYGAFVELEGTGGMQGLVHISELDNRRVRSVRDVLEEGERLTVLCVGIDPKTGNIKLSRKALLGQNAGGEKAEAKASTGKGRSQGRKM